MLNSQSNFSIGISKRLYLYFALLLLLIPIRLLFAAIVSAAIHELFHIAALYWTNTEIYSIRIDVHGAKIDTAPMTYRQELVCALAGPLGGGLLLLFARWMPLVALSGAIQSLYNLLPLYPTDGGRALNCILHFVFADEAATKILVITETIFLMIMIACSIYCFAILRLGSIPMVFAAALVLQWENRK